MSMTFAEVNEATARLAELGCQISEQTQTMWSSPKIKAACEALDGPLREAETLRAAILEFLTQ